MTKAEWGQALRAARESVDLTQTELAAKVGGRMYTAVSRWELGAYPRPSTREQIIGVLTGLGADCSALREPVDERRGPISPRQQRTADYEVRLTTREVAMAIAAATGVAIPDDAAVTMSDEDGDVIITWTTRETGPFSG